MKGIIVVSPVLTGLFSLGQAEGIVIFPFIFLAKPQLKFHDAFMNHEQIHYTQIIETGVFLFYLLYFIEFLWHYAKLRNRYAAYRQISFENEAYSNENNLEYLKTRRFWAFRAYLKNTRNTA